VVLKMKKMVLKWEKMVLKWKKNGSEMGKKKLK
jgi:hypothetical protein